MGRPREKGKQYERYVARRRGAEHLGGPGEPDFVEHGLLGAYAGEVKDWERPMNSRDVEREWRKGREIIESKSGYTDDALRFAQKHPELQLYYRGSRVSGSDFSLWLKKLFG